MSSSHTGVDCHTDDDVRYPSSRGCQSCRSCCFNCTELSGEKIAASAKKLSPKTIKGAKQCALYSVLMLCVAIGLIVQSFLVSPYLHNVLVATLQKAVLLNDSTTDQFATWTNNSDNPLIMTTYIYHIANPLGILAGETPELIEKGPYVYKQYTLNYDIQFGSNETYFGPDSTNRTLSFRTYNSYEFVPEDSVGDESTVVTTLNMPFIAMRAIYMWQGQYKIFHDLFSKYFIYENAGDDVRMFSNRTIHEVLFGWEDPIMKLLHKTYNGLIKNYPSLAASQADEFADNFYNIIYTGGDDTFPRIRDFITWHKQPYISTCPLPFPTDQCDLSVNIPAWGNVTMTPDGTTSSKLRGNDGSVFPTPINEQSQPAVFYSPFLRSIDLEFKQSTSYRGVPLLQFGFPDTFWRNSQLYPSNTIFNQDGPDGLINMTSIQAKIPLYASQPRYQDSAAELQSAFNVQFADEDVISGTVFEVEPDSGVSFHVYTSSQVNVLIDPLAFPDSLVPGNITWFSGLKQPFFFPVMWASEEGGIKSSDAATIETVLEIMQISKIGGLTIGIFLVILSFVYFFLCWRTYDLENNKHLSAIRSLLSSSTVGADGMPATQGGSLLDSSVLIMQDDPDHDPFGVHADSIGSGKKKRHSDTEVEGIDITYKPPTISNSYQSD